MQLKHVTDSPVQLGKGFRNLKKFIAVQDRFDLSAMVLSYQKDVLSFMARSLLMGAFAVKDRASLRATDLEAAQAVECLPAGLLQCYFNGFTIYSW